LSDGFTNKNTTRKKEKQGGEKWHLRVGRTLVHITRDVPVSSLNLIAYNATRIPI